MNQNRTTWHHIRTALLAIGIPAGAIAGYYFLFMDHKKEEKEGDEIVQVEEKIVSITIGTVQEQIVKRSIETNGSLHAFEDITISAKVEGHVRKIDGEVAERVEPEKVLLEIDTTMYDLSVRQAERALQVELSRMGLSELPNSDFDILKLPTVKMSQSKLTFSKSSAERMQQLAQSRSVSSEELEAATAELRTNEADYENQILLAKGAVATIGMRREALAVAKQQLQDTTVRAPMPSHDVPYQTDKKLYAIASRKVSEGTYVRTGTELFRLVIDSTLRLRVNVPERFASDVCDGLPVEVQTLSNSPLILGKVTRIAPVVDPLNRTFLVEIEIDNTKSKLKPGTFAKASIITKEAAKALVVPIESIVSFAGVTKLFVVEGDQVREVQVKLGTQGTTWVEIAEPLLSAGTQVVTSGQTVLADGSKIQIRKSESTSESTSETEARLSSAKEAQEQGANQR